MALHHFLIIYNLREGRLVSLTPFDRDARTAAEAYAAVEEAYRERADQGDYEIVLVGADSLETIQVTHSRYFDHDRELMPFAS